MPGWRCTTCGFFQALKTNTEQKTKCSCKIFAKLQGLLFAFRLAPKSCATSNPRTAMIFFENVYCKKPKSPKPNQIPTLPDFKLRACRPAVWLWVSQQVSFRIATPNWHFCHCLNPTTAQTHQTHALKLWVPCQLSKAKRTNWDWHHIAQQEQPRAHSKQAKTQCEPTMYKTKAGLQRKCSPANAPLLMSSALCVKSSSDGFRIFRS